ncbi:hypothetical protein [Bacillus sp. EB01]|uniref:hypothetical protein n=1 Tax=Bacillus sp. EB01 TaxID=1347086 RepID=UPI0005C49994|nr:hypothetical protein [Bacillus sp. EB01]
MVGVKNINGTKAYRFTFSNFPFEPQKKSYKATIKYKNIDVNMLIVMHIDKDLFESVGFNITEEEHDIQISTKGKKEKDQAILTIERRPGRH